MTLTLSTEQTTRINMARYLLFQAKQQITKPEPLNSLALLPIHDAIEFFLDVVADAAGVHSTKRMEFGSYWSALATATIPVSIPMQREMEKLNKARVALKHHGQRVSNDQLQSHLNNADIFLKSTCLDIFSIDLLAISLIEFIESEDIKKLLNDATAAQTEKKFSNSYESLARAFDAGLRLIYESKPFSFPNYKLSSRP